MNLATLLIIMWITVLIGICFLVKRLNTIEKNMVEIHNHLVDGLDHFMREETKHHENLVNGIVKCFNEMGMKLDNLQENWSDLKTGSIQVLTVK